ncbi:MAG: prolyl aminopeptidase [Gammaproteobacteria bacterium]|nr:prolyl aminopeptidase [Gammaproteobacteria bacterium]
MNHRGLYPPIAPFDQGFLKVSDIHTLYYEQSGNPAGKPVVVLHGGPGAGCSPRMRQFFDPGRYRVILFDQRGCGRSTPHACLEQNTTWDLVADIERLRELLEIERWQVFGGSWGSALALAYAQTHPDRISELVLRGIFTLQQSELDWFYQSGAGEIYPDAFEDYLRPIPVAERHDMVHAYHRRLTSSDPKVQLEAARAWSRWEGCTSHLQTSSTLMETFQHDAFVLAFARIECHYFVNHGFFSEDGYLLKNIDRIRHLPAVIVQGRYDVVCPMVTAWRLHRAWPEARFEVVPDAGHAAFEPGIQQALLAATDEFR